MNPIAPNHRDTALVSRMAIERSDEVTAPSHDLVVMPGFRQAVLRGSVSGSSIVTGYGAAWAAVRISSHAESSIRPVFQPSPVRTIR